MFTQGIELTSLCGFLLALFPAFFGLRPLLFGGAVAVAALSSMRTLLPGIGSLAANFSSDAGMGAGSMSSRSDRPLWISWLVQNENFYKHDNLILRSAATHGLDPDLWKAVVMVESAGDERAVSRRGAMGLAQLMPPTAYAMGAGRYKLFDPKANLNAGAKYLNLLVQRFDGNLNLALAAFNAGPMIVGRHRKVPSYRETLKFVDSVLALRNWLHENSGYWVVTRVPEPMIQKNCLPEELKLLEFPQIHI